MKLRTLTITALAALSIAACSSGDASDSTTGSSDSTPGATQTAADPGDSGDSGDSGDTGGAPTDFCDALEGMDDIDEDLTAATDQLSDVLDDQSTWNDPATIAELHDAGQFMLDEIPAVTDYYEAAAATVDDAEVSAALLALGDLYDVYFRAMAEAAVNANDVMGYALSFGSAMGDEDMSQVLADGTAAAFTVGQYGMTHCVN